MKSVTRSLAVLLSLLPLVVLAQPRPPEQRRGPDPERAEKMEKRMRMMRLLGLAEALDLEPEQALKLDAQMKKFDERRKPLREQVRESAAILERASHGDQGALNQVEQAARRAFDARAQLAQLDREMYEALSRDLSPQKRAQMALFLARFEGQTRVKVMKFRNGGHPGGPFGSRLEVLPPPGMAHLELRDLDLDEDL